MSTIKTPERRSGLFIVNFEQISHVFLVFPLLILILIKSRLRQCDLFSFFLIQINLLPPFYFSDLYSYTILPNDDASLFPFCEIALLITFNLSDLQINTSYAFSRSYKKCEMYLIRCISTTFNFTRENLPVISTILFCIIFEGVFLSTKFIFAKLKIK